ncbi:M23 family metallopeptidase [Candidatus Woesearchaeota archaeon]|nr:M23 family metallopeptidase [Candidatus Woesearchaeota archaeon]
MTRYQQVILHDIPPGKEGYRLPFQGEVRIIQGHNGPLSHRSFKTVIDGHPGLLQDDRFSLDFGLPLETVVLAARAGEVYFCSDKYHECYRGTDFDKGMKMSPNVVYLQHPDRTFTVYSHLAAGSLLVQNNEAVEQGQPLARTGLSGWIGPEEHLHFAALNMSAFYVRSTFPAFFEDYEGPLEHEELPFFAGRRIER